MDTDSEDFDEILSNIESWNLTYDGWEDDFARVDKAYNEGTRWQRERLFSKMQKKQAVHDGDRSHVQLVKLDELTLSYPGWIQDYDDCEHTHFEFDGKVFWDKLKGLESKQLSYFNHSKDPDLMELDSIQATYPGCKDDYRKAAEAHYAGNEPRFQRFLQKLQKKQAVYSGDRSHPNLKAIDSLQFTFPNWENDVEEAERVHVEFEGKAFWDKLQGLRSKEKMYRGDRSHPNLVKLDELSRSLVYVEWERDKKKAEQAHMSGNEWRFKRVVEQIKKKQADFNKRYNLDRNDRSVERSKSFDKYSEMETKFVIKKLREKINGSENGDSKSDDQSQDLNWSAHSDNTTTCDNPLRAAPARRGVGRSKSTSGDYCHHSGIGLSRGASRPIPQRRCVARSKSIDRSDSKALSGAVASAKEAKGGDTSCNSSNNRRRPPQRSMSMDKTAASMMRTALQRPSRRKVTTEPPETRGVATEPPERRGVANEPPERRGVSRRHTSGAGALSTLARPRRGGRRNRSFDEGLSTDDESEHVEIVACNSHESHEEESIHKNDGTSIKRETSRRRVLPKPSHSSAGPKRRGVTRRNTSEGLASLAAFARPIRGKIKLDCDDNSVDKQPMDIDEDGGIANRRRIAPERTKSSKRPTSFRRTPARSASRIEPAKRGIRRSHSSDEGIRKSHSADGASALSAMIRPRRAGRRKTSFDESKIKSEDAQMDMNGGSNHSENPDKNEEEKALEEQMVLMRMKQKQRRRGRGKKNEE